MRERIALTEEMIVELLQLRDEGKGLRSLGDSILAFLTRLFKRWLESDEVAKFVASTDFKGFARGDNAKTHTRCPIRRVSLKGKVIRLPSVSLIPKHTPAGFRAVACLSELKLMFQWMPSKK